MRIQQSPRTTRKRHSKTPLSDATWLVLLLIPAVISLASDPPSVKGDNRATQVSKQLDTIVERLGAADSKERDAAFQELIAMGARALPDIEQALKDSETAFKSVSRKFHGLKKLVLEIGWPGASRLHDHLRNTHGENLKHFGPVNERFGSQYELAEKLFAKHRFFTAFIDELPPGYEFYAVTKFDPKWVYVSRSHQSEDPAGQQNTEASLVKLARNEGIQLEDKVTVQDFVQVSYTFLGAGPSLGCATGIEFRSRIEKTRGGWTAYAEHRNVGFGKDTPDGKWTVRWTTTLLLDAANRLEGISRGVTPGEPD